LDDLPKGIDNWEENESLAIDLKLNLTLVNVSGAGNKVLMSFQVENIGKELRIYTVSEKSRTSFLAGYSLITLYLSVVLVAGNVIRGVFSGTYTVIMYEEIPDATPLLKLCDGVSMARYTNDLIEESVLYWTLIEVLRSNELMKLITKTSQDIYPFASKNISVDNEAKIEEEFKELREEIKDIKQEQIKTPTDEPEKEE